MVKGNTRYDREAVLTAWAAGETGRAIDAALGMAHGVAAEIARQARVAGDARAVPRTTAYRFDKTIAWHAEATREWQAGMSKAEVARRHEKSARAVHNMLERSGAQRDEVAPPPPPPPRADVEDLVPRLPALMAEHGSLGGIADALGVHRNTLGRLWARSGLPPMTRGKASTVSYNEDRETVARRRADVLARFPALLQQHGTLRVVAAATSVDRLWLGKALKNAGVVIKRRAAAVPKPEPKPKAARVVRPRPVLQSKPVSLPQMVRQVPVQAQAQAQAPAPPPPLAATLPAQRAESKLDQARRLLERGQEPSVVRMATGLELWRLYALRAEIREDRRQRA